jgi:hypothetical protein
MKTFEGFHHRKEVQHLEYLISVVAAGISEEG